MSDPRKLLDETAVPLERELLLAGLTDAAPPGASSRAATALGLTAAVATTAAATSASAKTAGLGASATLVKSAGVAIALLAIGIAITVGLGTRRSPAPTTPAGQTLPPAQAVSVPLVTPLPSEAPIAAAPASASASADLAAAPSSPGSAHRPSPASSGASLGDEIALLDRARTALSAGDAATALRLLDEHDARFQSGTFALESTVMRIDALDALGRGHAALALADRFLAAHPNAAMSQHVRSVADRLRRSP